jgi:hypothetical protein
VRLRCARWGWAALGMMMLQVLLALPARADGVLDCLGAAAAPFIQATKGAVFAAQHPQCAAKAAEPTPKFSAALVAVGAAMAAGWLPEDGEACIGAKWKVAGKLMSAVLDVVPVDLPAGVSKKDIQAELNTAGYDLYQEIVASNPALQELDSLFNCACLVDSFAKDQANDAMNKAKHCGGFIVDVVNVLGGAFEGWGEGVAQLPCAVSLNFAPGCKPTHTAPSCWANSCSVGQQCYSYEAGNTKDLSHAGAGGVGTPANKDCGACSQVKYAVGTSTKGLCACPKGFLADYTPWYGKQQLLKSCTCPPPLSAVWTLNPTGVEWGLPKWGLGWECRCPEGQVLTPAGKCETFCGLDQKAVKTIEITEAPSKSPVAQTILDAVSKVAGALSTDILSKEKWHCEQCGDGTMSDGTGPCIPCAGEKAFPRGWLCDSCKPWQNVLRIPTKFGGTRCEDICLNGVYQPAVLPQVHGPGELVYGVAGPPEKKGQKTAAPTGPPVSVAKQVGAVGQTPRPSDRPSSSLTGTVALAKQDCVPCEDNSVALNNQCHPCGTDAVADLAARTCNKCDKGQVAKHIGGAWLCAADCSTFGRKEDLRTSARYSSNYVNDPKDSAHCVPCTKGRPNAAHTDCVVTASIPQGPPTVTEVPIPVPVPVPGGVRCPSGWHKDLRSGACVVNPPPTMARARLVCRGGQVPNPTGTACISLRRRPTGGQAEFKRPPGQIAVPTRPAPSSKRVPVPR